MKKLICLVLALLLALSAALAAAEVEYSLPEKWQRQVDFGNGVKGTLTLNFQGTAEWISLVQGINGVPLELRGIRADNVFQYRVYFLQGEEMAGLTQLHGDADNIYLQSELLPETVLRFAANGDWIDAVAGREAGNMPTFYSALVNILNVPQTTWESKWLPAMEPYTAAIEAWLEDYASAPSVLRGENGATVLVRYDIPADAVKSEIKVLWDMLLKDEQMSSLMRVQLTQEQAEVYLNPHLMYYYEQIIDELALPGSIVLERELTARGDIVRTDMSFPVALEGWNSLIISQKADNTVLRLAGAVGQAELQLKQTGGEDRQAYSGKLFFAPAEAANQGLALDFTLSTGMTTSVDEDTREHLINDIELTVKPAADMGEGNWTSFEPVKVKANIHFDSKPNKNSPVGLTVDVQIDRADMQIGAVLDMTTRSKWVMDELSVANAVDITTLKQEELLQMLTDIGLNGVTMVMMMNSNAE